MSTTSLSHVNETGLWSNAGRVRRRRLPALTRREYPSASIAGIASPTREGNARRFAEACGADLAAISLVAPVMEPRHLEDAGCYGCGFTYPIGVKTSPPTDTAVFEDLGGFQ